jgi:predicted HNH restriction endonuclease
VTPSFGTARDYYRALRAVESEGIHPSHRDLLRAHFAAPEHTVSWRQLAPSVGYRSAEPVKLQYGAFARRMATHLGVSREQARGFWLHVIADWAVGLDPRGHTMFTLRPEMVSALKQMGWVERAPAPNLLETDDPMLEGRPELRLVAHRHRESALRTRKIAAALRESPDGRLRCAVPGCGFCFEEAYGPRASDYIQVHHLEPLGERNGPSSTRLKDLVLVCANCHAMIHYLSPSPPLGRLIRPKKTEA